MRTCAMLCVAALALGPGMAAAQTEAQLAGRLTTVGYGSEELLAPERPEDASNRRVEVRDLGSAN